VTKRQPLSLRIAAPLVIGALLLSGCDDSSGKPGESESPSPTAGPTGTADPSPTATTSPTDAPTESPDEPLGPEAVIREFARVHNDLLADGDAKAFRAMGHNCDYCRDFSKRIEAIYDRGGYVKSKGWAIRSITLVQKRGTRRAYRVILFNAPAETKERKGAPLKNYPGEQETLIFGVWQIDGAWKISGVGE
jgi:hypothetical protein